MGIILYLECEKDKEHNDRFSLGVGKMFPGVYQDVINAIKKGDYGKDIQQFLKDNPKCAINCEKILVQCPKCNRLEKVFNLSMYIPRKNYDSNKDKGIARWAIGMPFMKKIMLPNLI